jgi:hypothetical protein
MTDIEVKQLIERLRQRINSNYVLLSNPPKPAPDADCHMAADLLQEALAFKQEVSDALYDYFTDVDGAAGNTLDRFFIPKPDPLAEAMLEIGVMPLANNLRAKLEARGLEIRSKNDD